MTKLSDQQRALALLKKYKAGRCTPEEIALVEQWYDAFGQGEISPEDEAAIAAATQNILSSTAPGNQSGQAKVRNLRVWISAAACVVLAVTAAVWFIKSYNQVSEQANQVYTTLKGQRKEIELPDGSKISLNAASTLTLINFGKQTRTVALNGEAFFHIAKDRQHPFIIKTGKIQTHVIGTSFNIYAYQNEPVIRVAVSTGKVQVEDSHDPRHVLGSGMTFNHLFSYNKADGSHSLVETDVQGADAWLSHRLSFSKAGIHEIAHTLERTFNVPVKVIGANTETNHYTVKFDQENLDIILKQLNALTGANCRRTNSGVIIDLQQQ